MRLRQYFVVRQKLPFPLAEATVLVIQGCHAQVVNLDLRNNEQADVEANSDGTQEARTIEIFAPWARERHERIGDLRSYFNVLGEYQLGLL